MVGYRPDLGILLVGFPRRRDADQRRLRPTGRDREKWLPAAGRCTTAHDSGDFDMFALQPQYLRVVLDNGFRLPAGYLDFAESFGRIQQVLAAGGMASVPCHNDLLAANFIEDGDRVWLIDYEYWQQRSELRARQHLARVRAVRRPARGTRHRLPRCAVATRTGACAAPGHRVAVRVDPVGMHPEWLQRNGFRLLELGDGAL